MDRSGELCATCSKIDFFSLFTGPRYFPGNGYDHKLSVSLGTLAEVTANTECSFCRLVHHDLHKTGWGYLWPRENDYVDPSKVQVAVNPIRADYHEEMKYIDEKTRDMVGTRLEVRLFPLEGLSKLEQDVVLHHHCGNGIQVLSPNSVDPARPLLNGYKATTTSNSLDLLRKWMETCQITYSRVERRGLSPAVLP
jgi:hypothetical protein